MKLVRPLLVAWLLGSIAGGCTSDLRLALEGKSCNAAGLCVDGYVCNQSTNECVPRSLLDDGGPEGDAGSHAGVAGSPVGGVSGSGQGGAGAGHAGLGGNPGLAGGAGADAGGDELDGGADGSSDVDGCVPTTIFRDEDGDTYGDVTEDRFGCPEPGWVTRAGDCRDDIAIVNPGQGDFFGQGYTDQGKPGNISFDYDCTAGEQPDPDNDPSGEPPDCESLGAAVSCMGAGYLPADPPRAGPGINPLCGSVRRRNCVVDGLLLSCGSEDLVLDVGSAFRCK